MVKSWSICVRLLPLVLLPSILPSKVIWVGNSYWHACETSNNNNNNNHLTAFCLGLSGWVVTRRNIHPLLWKAPIFWVLWCKGKITEADAPTMWLDATPRILLVPHLHHLQHLMKPLSGTHNHFTALWIFSGTTRVSRYQKKHSPTHTYRGHQSYLSAFSIYYDPWHPPCSIHVPDSLFPQSLSKFYLVYLLAWHPPLHTPYIFFTQSLSSFWNTCPYH